MSRYIGWGIIVDDIVFPDGRSAMGILGGGGFYAAIGMRLWTEDVVIQSAVGHDFDPGIVESYGLDSSGLQVTELPTLRAWQLFEEDGRRTQIFRVPEEVVDQQLVDHPSQTTLPATLRAAHYLLRGDPREEQMVLDLVSAGVQISAEPVIEGTMTPDEHASLLRCVTHFEIFSPSTTEATALVGERPVKEQLRAMADLGPNVVALRRGAEGSIVFDRKSNQFWRVPAAKAKVVDVTGAGNAYCGGLLVGWLELGDIQQAAARAAVSAAIAIEQVGPPHIDEAMMSAALRRAKQLLKEIHRL